MPYEKYNWIDDRLAIGGAVDAPDDTFPFDAVLSLERHSPIDLGEWVRSGGVDYQWQPIIDAYCWEDHDAIVRRFDDAAEQIDVWLRDDKRVLVHCAAGVSRSVTAVMRYLTRYRGYTWEGAYDFVLQNRPQANPNVRFAIPLRMDAGEQFTPDEVRAMIRDWCDMKRAETGEIIDPAEIWDDLVLQGTIARMEEGGGASGRQREMARGAGTSAG